MDNQIEQSYATLSELQTKHTAAMKQIEADAMLSAEGKAEQRQQAVNAFEAKRVALVEGIEAETVKTRRELKAKLYSPVVRTDADPNSARLNYRSAMTEAFGCQTEQAALALAERAILSKDTELQRSLCALCAEKDFRSLGAFLVSEKADGYDELEALDTFEQKYGDRRSVAQKLSAAVLRSAR